MPAAHLHGDSRTCGATTVVVGQSTVYVNDKLWAVEGDINTDGNGQLIATQSTVIVEDKKVIVNTPDHAQQDDKCIPIGPPHCDPFTAAGSDDTNAY